MDEFGFLTTACGDFVATRLMLRERLYPQAVFSAQQCVEKMNKSLGLFIGIFKPNDLRDVRHDTMRLMEAIGRSMTQQGTGVAELIEQHPHFRGTEIAEQHPHMVANAQTLMTTVDRTRERLGRGTLTLRELDELTAEVDEADESISHSTPKSWDEAGRRMACAIADLNHRAGTPLSIEDREKLDRDMLALMPVMSRFMGPSARLMALAQAFMHHAIPPRYGWDGRTPAQLYRASTPIVKRLPRLMKLMEETLEMLDDLYRAAKRLKARDAKQGGASAASGA